MTSMRQPFRIQPLDEVLTSVQAVLNRCGLPCADMRFTADGIWLLRFGELRGGQEVAVEPASDTRPADVCLAMGRHRLRTLEPFMGRSELRRELLLRLRTVLLRIWPESIGFWLALPNHGLREVSRSVAGLRSLLVTKIPFGQPFWKTWRWQEIREEQGPSGSVFLLGFGDGNSLERWYRLEDFPSGDSLPEDDSVWHLNTPLGRVVLVVSDETTPSPGLSPLDTAVGFLVSRAIPDAIRWVDAPTDDSQRPDKPSQDRRRMQPLTLETICLSGASTVGEAHSRFFAPWGNLNDFAIGGLVSDEGGIVFHASRECMMYCSLISRFPHGRTVPWEAGTTWNDGQRFYVTDMRDAEAVRGGESRLAQALERVGTQTDGPIRVFMGCEFRTMGDDPPGVARGCSPGIANRVRYMRDDSETFENVDCPEGWSDFLDRALCRPLRTAEVPTVNLVGYGHADGDSVRDLCALLLRTGVHVGTVVFPSQSPGAADRFADAHITVTSPWAPVEDLFARELRRRGVPCISPPVPYGIQGTLRWLKTIHEALGRQPSDWEHPLQQIQSDFKPLWDEAHRQVRDAGSRMLFMFDHGTWEEFLSPRFFFGTSPLAIFEDTGVPVTVIRCLHTPSPFRKGPADGTAATTPPVAPRENVRFVEFPPGTSLADALAGQEGSVLYCDAQDVRAFIALGLVPVSIRELRPGLRGHLRNLSALQARSSLQLFSRYGPFSEEP